MLEARQTGSSIKTKVLLRVMLIDTTVHQEILVKQALRAGQQGLFLSLSIDESVTLLQIRKDRTHALLLLLGLAVATSCVVIWMGGRYIREPAARLADAAVRLRAGDLTARARVSPEAWEFSTLADDFNAMAEALDARERALQASERQHRAVFETAV